MIFATRVAPSAYVLETRGIRTGTTFTAHGQSFEVVGEPVKFDHCGVSVRVREIGGTHDGNEFAAALYYRLASDVAAEKEHDRDDF